MKFDYTLLRFFFNYIARKFYNKDYCLLCNKLSNLNVLTRECLNSPNLQTITELLILGEDRRFFKHIGFDIFGICRAIVQIVIFRKIEGASTIEQQLVRVLIGDFRRSVPRKVKEIILATVVEKYILKRNIPISYLYVAHFGTNIDGIDAIMNRLKLKPDDCIRIEIAAEIVARIKYPEPTVFNEKQFVKIENRKLHLIRLYKRKPLICETE